MSTLAQLAAESKSWFPSIDPLAPLTLVQRAYQDIRKSREWSFLKQVGVWFAPSPITTGTANVTFLSTSVVFDATAAPLLNAVASTPAPEQPLIVRQFRVSGGPLYNIVAWNGSNTATLNRPYTESSNPTASFMVYQPYVQAPSLDFKRWLSWVDPLNDYRFRYRNLYRTQKEVDRRDPQRMALSVPIWIATHDYVVLPGESQQRPRFEAWPHPSQQIGYVIEYMTTGDVGASLSALLPAQITDQCIVARLKYYCHELCANQPNVDVKVKSFHMQQQRTALAEYVDLLQRCKLDDNSIFDASVVTEEDSGPTLNGPLDADYLQSHELFYIG